MLYCRDAAAVVVQVVAVAREVGETFSTSDTPELHAVYARARKQRAANKVVLLNKI